MRSLASFLIAALAVISGARAQTDCSGPWADSLKRGLEDAASRGVPALVLCTVGGHCDECRALEAILASPDVAKVIGRRYAGVRLLFAGCGKADREQQAFAAAAALPGYPTLYLLDAEGWPLWVMHGNQAFTPPELLTALAAGEQSGREVVARARRQGRKGLRALFRWYQEQEIPLGVHRAAAALYPSAATDAERAELAPHLVAAALAERGAHGADPYLEVLERADRDGRRGLRPRALQQAGDILLRSCEHEAACRHYGALVALEDIPGGMRADAEMGLAFCCRKLGLPCLAREHYQRVIEVAAKLPDDEGAAFAAQAAKRLEETEACSRKPCPCDRRRR